MRIIVPLIEQIEPTSCWAACLEMIYRYYNKSSKYLQKFLIGEYFSGLKSTEEIKQILTMNGGYHYTKDEDQLILSEDQIKSEINANRPIMVGVLTADRQEGHSMLAIGYETDPFQLIINDPKDGTEKIFPYDKDSGIIYGNMNWQDTIYGIRP